MCRTVIEKDKSNMLSFVLNSQEQVIHFMFIIQVELSRVIFSYLFFYVYKIFFLLWYFCYISRRVWVLNQYVIKLPKQFNQILSEKV